MAHECPECYSICYCTGDVDDCLLNLEEDVTKCVHWKKCEPVAIDMEDDVWQEDLAANDAPELLTGGDDE